jgi:Spy/CpxP family protein refolding chaperone
MEPAMTRLLTLALLVATAACARAPGPELPGATRAAVPGDLERRVFPPELIMEHQAALGLAPTQRDAIAAEAAAARATVEPLQWELGAEKEKLAALLDADAVDEAQTLAAAQRVLALEGRIKTAHLAMLVRVRNQLEPRQVEKLRAWRQAR